MNTISPINRTYAPLQVLVDELARCGMTHAVTSPGSRNAPLALVLAADERIEAISVLDERSAGFVALGIARSTGAPVAVTCTSGTAAANLLPAVAEAHEAGIPLLVLTADRPPELREVGAGQALDQVKLYGRFAKWFCEVGNHDPGREAAVHHRALGCRAWWTASGGRPGPVHLNFPLREPLAPAPEEMAAEPWQGRDGGRPWTLVEEWARAAPAGVPGAGARGEAGLRVASGRGVIVCGPLHGRPLGPAAREAVARLAARSGWPVLAEPASGMRCGPHDRSHVIAHYDVLLRARRFAERHVPEVAVRVGDMPTSKPLRGWLPAAEQIVIDPGATWHEPTRHAGRLVVADPVAALDGLEGTERPDPGWVASWRAADALVPPLLAALPWPSEPLAYTALAPMLAAGDTLFVSSSMPVRDVESFFPSLDADVRFLSNRGANGIDGVTSSAVGAAMSAPGRTFLVTGELALLHDLGGLVARRRHSAPLTIVCADNGGGGIFDFLPVAGEADAAAYEEHIATPAGTRLADLATLGGLPHAIPGSAAELRELAMAGPVLIEVRTDRAENVRLHRELVEAVAARLG